MSLLSRAKEIKQTIRAVGVSTTDEELDLIFGVIRGEITVFQAGKVTGKGPNYSQWAGKKLLHAAKDGRIIRVPKKA